MLCRRAYLRLITRFVPGVIEENHNQANQEDRSVSIIVGQLRVRN